MIAQAMQKAHELLLAIRENNELLRKLIALREKETS